MKMPEEFYKTVSLRGTVEEAQKIVNVLHKIQYNKKVQLTDDEYLTLFALKQELIRQLPSGD